MQVGEAIGGGWDIYKRFWRHLLPIAFVVYLVISLITILLVAIAGVLGEIASAFVSIVGLFWVQAALVEAVADVRDGRADLTLGETLQRVRPRIWSVAGAGILAAIGIVIGLVLIIIPGLILLTMWSLITPVIVLERKAAMASFGRSRDLVRGHGWTVFGVILVTIVLLAVVGAIISLILSPLGDELQRYVSDVVSNTVFVPLVASIWTVMYFRLRELKEPAAAAPAIEGAAYSE